MSKNLISIVKIGKVPYQAYTLPAIRNYAEKIGADLHFVTKMDPQYLGCVYCQKFQSVTHFINSDYDNLAVIDLDLIISPTCPDFFTDHSEGFWACATELQGHLSQKYSAGLKKVFGKEFLDKVRAAGHDYPYCSAGVWIMDQLFAKRVDPLLQRYPYLASGGDQAGMHWACYHTKSPVNHLNRIWNCVPRLLPKVLARGEKPHILHFGGQKNLSTRMANTAKKFPECADWGFKLKGVN